MAGRSAAEIRAKQQEISAAVVEAQRIAREQPELLEKWRQELAAENVGRTVDVDLPAVPMLLWRCEE